MERLFSYRILPPDAGKTIEQFLRAQGFSHHLLISLKHSENGICLNGSRMFTNHILAAGDLSLIHI